MPESTIRIPGALSSGVGILPISSSPISSKEIPLTFARSNTVLGGRSTLATCPKFRILSTIDEGTFARMINNARPG